MEGRAWLFVHIPAARGRPNDTQQEHDFRGCGLDYVPHLAFVRYLVVERIVRVPADRFYTRL